MTASLLAKLTPKGIPLDGGIGGEPEWTAQEVAALLSRCGRKPYLTILTKYTRDTAAEHALRGLIASIARPWMIREDLEHPEGIHIGSALIGNLVVKQFQTRHRLTVRQTACALKIPKTTYHRRWKPLIGALENELAVWEAQGTALFNERRRQNAQEG